MTEPRAPGPLGALPRAYRLTFRTDGRAGRAEMLWFTLYSVAVLAAAALADARLEAAGVSYPYARLAAVLLLLPGLALGVRRLRDAGASGWWILACAVPVAAALLVLFVLLRRSAPQARTGRRRLWPYLVLPALVLMAAKYEAFSVPSGSMKPALLPGDHVIVDVLAYGWPCFGFCGPVDRLAPRPPARGEVAVFLHPHRPGIFVKRIAGLGGDTVQMRGGALWLNGAPVPAQEAGTYSEPMAPQGPAQILPRCANAPVPPGAPCLKTQLLERLDGRGFVTLHTGETMLDNTAPLPVPPGHVLVLGDNRDNSVDSRLAHSAGGVGTVPVSRLVGRAVRIAFSEDGNFWSDPAALRAGRFWKDVP